MDSQKRSGSVNSQRRAIDQQEWTANMNDNPLFGLQEMFYEFPYHYLARIDDGKSFRLHRELTWGLDYMTYVSFIAELIGRNHPESLLDVGCGDGRLIHMIKSLVPRISGVDLSERAIAFARAFNPDVDFLCGDVAQVSEKYAWVTLVEVMEHIPDHQMPEFVRNIARLVQDDGLLLISVPTVNTPLNKKHYRHYNLPLLKDTLSTHFEIQNYWWLYRLGILEKLIHSVVCNSLYVLNSTLLLASIWRMHKSLTYHADASTGLHLVCLAKLR